MTAAIRVRPAVASDAAAWSWIVREASEERPPVIATQPEEVWSAAAFAERLRGAAQAGEALLVAEADARVAGVMGVHRGSRLATRHTAELGITGAADARGRGIGRALMLAAEAWARDVGVRKLTLGVFAHNERAVRLYRGLGYVEEGVRRGQYLFPSGPVDELLMAKWLEADG